MMMKVEFIIVALLMAGIVSPDVLTEGLSPSPAPAPAPIDNHSSPPQSETKMSPSPSPFPEANDLSHTDITGTKGGKPSGGGNKVRIAVVMIAAAASVIGVGGYVLKKRRENIRRSRYGYAATEII